jgi:RimJ/RimL family protein N-acetyltransferase
MTPVSSLGPRMLSGRFIALEPLEPRHHEALLKAADDRDLWRYIPIEQEPNGFAKRLKWLAQSMESGDPLTFAVRRLSDGAIVGSTSYLALSADNARVEIGFTWYIAGVQGTAVNPEAKYLLLDNAFSALYHRVEFKTDARNARSRAALAKLGAKEEGILRGHMWMPQGYHRDSVYFSILAPEWPAVRTALEKRLQAFAP